MAWFRHHYHCESCHGSWLAEAEAAIEADCPFCRERDVVPYKSDDRTVVIEEHQQLFVVLEAMKSASRNGDYRKLKSFPTRDKAEAFISGRLRRVS